MSGQITYFELPSSDNEATQRFWGSLFGWTFHAHCADDQGVEFSLSQQAGDHA